MRVLIDTHTFLWFVLNDEQLSKKALAIVQNPTNEICISPATYWEIAIKVGLKKLELHTNYDDFMQRGIAGNRFEVLPIETKHTSLLIQLPLHHRDPFDRLLVAQAMQEKLPIVSADEQLDAYPVTRLW
jgi:PIN domain nuclease of toxin-antitoxin system